MAAPSMRAILVLLSSHGGASVHPCDLSATEASLLTTPVRCGDGTFEDEHALLACALEDGGAGDDGTAACLALRRGWWQAAKALTPKASEPGRVRIRQLAEHVKRGAAGVFQQLTGSTGRRSDELSVVVPAVQWAQNASVVALAIRFSPKRHGPVSCANVDDPVLNLNASHHLSFAALARGKLLRFALSLQLAHAVVPEESTWKLTGTAGRATVQLAKAFPVAWTSLVADGEERRGHVSSWFEKQQFFDGKAKQEEANPEQKKAGGSDAPKAGGSDAPKVAAAAAADAPDEADGSSASKRAARGPRGASGKKSGRAKGKRTLWARAERAASELLERIREYARGLLRRQPSAYVATLLVAGLVGGAAARWAQLRGS